MTEKAEGLPFLHKEDNQADEAIEYRHEKAHWWRRLRDNYTAHPLSPWVTHGITFLLTSAFWAAFVLTKARQIEQRPDLPNTGYDLGFGHTIFAKRKYISCGFSVEEARSLGCQYDMLSNHFVPSQCFDQRSIDDYKAQDDTWIGYVDKNWSAMYPSIQAMGESDTYWTNQRDHIIHCSMLWKRQWRAFTENWRYFDIIIADAEHTTHCIQFLIDMTDTDDSPDWRKVPISVEVGFSGCLDREELDDAFLPVSWR